jgi:hypothetical protein
MDLIKLIAALIYINEHVEQSHAVIGIEFEDGSGYKFNYHTNEMLSRWKFIDLTGKI